MIILIVITIFFQMTINSGYNPLIAYLPLSLAEKMAEIQGTPGSILSDRASRDSREDEEKRASSKFQLINIRTKLADHIIFHSFPSSFKRRSRWKRGTYETYRIKR